MKGQLRGAQVKITADLLFDWMGLDGGNIQLGAAAIDPNCPDILVLVLRGDDERLPIVEPGNLWPCATVVCERDETRPGIRGRLEIT